MGSGEMWRTISLALTGCLRSAIFFSHLRGEDMELLTDELRRQLPPIRKIHDLAGEGQCIIYAKFLTSRGEVVFYVAEGEQRNSDYLLWGMLIAPQLKFPSKFQITLGRLETKDWVGKEPCRRDENFQPARWEAVQRTIANLKRPVNRPVS